MKFKLTAIILLSSTSLLAQVIGSWNVLDVRKNTDKVISYQLEVQLRSLKFYHNFHYNEINFTANYKYNDNLVLSVLIGKHNTFSDGGDFMKPILTDEFRQSLQAVTVQRFGFISLDNRYRIEQRYFINRNSLAYRLRYRFGLQASVSKSIKAQFSNEIFLAIGGSNSTFEKNRILIGLKNTVNKRYEIQLNFLNQIDNRKNDESGRNFIQLVNIINI
jgi:Protein of unknown function (DUF2490)